MLSIDVECRFYFIRYSVIHFSLTHQISLIDNDIRLLLEIEYKGMLPVIHFLHVIKYVHTVKIIKIGFIKLKFYFLAPLQRTHLKYILEFFHGIYIYEMSKLQSNNKHTTK